VSSEYGQIIVIQSPHHGGFGDGEPVIIDGAQGTRSVSQSDPEKKLSLVDFFWKIGDIGYGVQGSVLSTGEGLTEEILLKVAESIR
jgi:hypothetical protein